MNVMTRSMAVIGVTFGLVGFANANTNAELVAADGSATSNICVSAAQGSKYKLKSAMETARVDKEYVLEKLSCNGMPIEAFVEQYSENPKSIMTYITNGRYRSDEYIARMNTNL
ncbi:DUF3718 domain-containing protein [Alteromonas sp. C1M14]|uniref:DUF3718 domain-containing protein n=1 Tax=Alteromonas sp. C1M14 TaxID=2841567 RepID=UPI001C08A50E|nr:DUF3718 domain-containing protein [Alteromonas sp. C1M14]MBU2977202.1 DUF3718 domain-containing protein [Alteromonas sp. C1M14]